MTFNLPAPPNFRGLDPNLPITIYHRHLPHWRQDGATYFVSFHLDDALPQAKLDELRALRQAWEAAHPPPRTEADWESYARTITVKAERWLDEGHGACYFNQPPLAKILADALLYFQDQRYFVSCYTVMPNHCHLLIRPFAGYDLEDILQVCKGYVANRINRIRGGRGELWQQESYDRIVRDEEHLYRIVQYIGRNPGRAGIPIERWVRWVHPTWQAAGWRFAEEIQNK